MATADLTHERLTSVLAYEPETGVFTWKLSLGTKKAGTRAGVLRKKDGYREISIDGTKYLEHRLAWLYVHGSWPQHEIDHEDTDRANNRISNFRPAGRILNMQNQRRAHRGNSTGLLGVTQRGKRFRAQIRIDGKKVRLGTFDTPELAHAAYLAAKRIHHPGNTL